MVFKVNMREMKGLHELSIDMANLFEPEVINNSGGVKQADGRTTCLFSCWLS